MEEGAAQRGAPEESELRFAEEGESPPDTEEIRPVTDFSIWDFVRMVLVLAFVVGLIYGLFYLLRRAQGAQGQQSGVIDVLASQSLPGNGMVHLVKVGTQVFMLGSSEQSLRLLTEIDDKESRDEVELRLAQLPGEERKSFSDLMSAMMASFGRESSEKSSVEGGAPEQNEPRASSAEGRPAEGVTRGTPPEEESSEAAGRSTAEARAEQEVLDYISSQRQRLRRLNS